MSGKLKLKEDGTPELKDGMPIWVLEDGKEEVFNAPKLFAAIGATREERDRALSQVEKLSSELAGFGATPEDRSKAAEALEAARNIDAKKMIDAGKVDQLVSERLKEATTKHEKEAERFRQREEKLMGTVKSVLIGSQFSRVKEIRPNSLLSPSLARALFSEHFGVKETEDGFQLIPYRDKAHQQTIYSAEDPQAPAGFDEAFSVLYDSHPERKSWTLGSNASGSGAEGGAGNGANEGTMSRAEFSKLPAHRQSDLSLKGIQLVD